MDRTMTLNFTPRLVIGSMLLWIGTFWLADEIGLHAVDPLIDYWPAGIILLAISIARHGGGWVSSLFVGGIGVWLLGESLGLFDLDFGKLWPLVLVFFGARMILKGAGIRLASPGAEGAATSSIAILANREHRITGSFAMTHATALLGSSTIDLTEASFADGASIDTFCLAGGIKLIVSPRTRVVSDVVPIMAGYEDKRRNHGSPVQTLTVRGVCVWGAVEVFSATPAAEGE